MKFEAPRGLKVEAPERFSPDLASGDTRGEVDEGGEVAAVQGQLAYGALLDDLAHLGGVGAGERGQRGDLGGLGKGAELQGHVHARALVHLQDDASPDVLPEALDLDRQLVGAGDQEGSGVAPRGCR